MTVADFRDINACYPNPKQGTRSGHVMMGDSVNMTFRLRLLGTYASAGRVPLSRYGLLQIMVVVTSNDSDTDISSKPHNLSPSTVASVVCLCVNGFKPGDRVNPPNYDG